MRVRKAVFPAAGWGTRFLPATKAQPKEMLPLVDKPVIQYAVEEAVAAGIEQVIIVTSSQKRAIEDHFDHSYELEHLLEERGDIEMLRRSARSATWPRSATCARRSSSAWATPCSMAKELVGHEPFAVILSDDVVVGERPCIGQLIDAYQPDPRVGGRGHGGAARGDRPLRRRSIPSPTATTAITAAAPGPRPRREAGPPDARPATSRSSAATC